MKPEKKTDIVVNPLTDEDMLVYEREIFDEVEEKTSLVPNTVASLTV